MGLELGFRIRVRVRAGVRVRVRVRIKVRIDLFGLFVVSRALETLHRLGLG